MEHRERGRVEEGARGGGWGRRQPQKQRMKVKKKTLSEWKRTHTGTQRAVRE